MNTIFKSMLFCLITAILIPSSASAELKLGIVNLDQLFKEIPIYNESQEKLKKNLILKQEILKL